MGQSIYHGRPNPTGSVILACEQFRDVPQLEGISEGFHHLVFWSLPDDRGRSVLASTTPHFQAEDGSPRGPSFEGEGSLGCPLLVPSSQEMF